MRHRSNSAKNTSENPKHDDSSSSDEEARNDENGEHNKSDEKRKRNLNLIEIKNRSSKSNGLITSTLSDNSQTKVETKKKIKFYTDITHNNSKHGNEKTDSNDNVVEKSVEELNKSSSSVKPSVKSSLRRNKSSSRTDLDKMNLNYDLNYDLSSALNGLEIRPAYKHLLRSIRSNL